MQILYTKAVNDTGPNAHPEVVAAYMQAHATLKLASEVAGIRGLLESGAAGVTVGIEK